jgi:hypothetical protein
MIEGHSFDKSDKYMKNHSGNSRLLIDLLRLIPSYSAENSFRKKKQIIKRKHGGQRKL